MRNAKLQFLREVVRHDGDACLYWPFAKPTKKRAPLVMKIDGQSHHLPRLICEGRHGLPPSPKHQAAHSCGNGHLWCVNPNHLRWATPKENSADRLAHGTEIRGRKNPMVRLAEKSVLRIKEMIADGMPNDKIAGIHKVHALTIESIRTGKSWAWLT